MVHSRLNQLAFYIFGSCPPPPPHGQIIGCRVEISLDPTSEKTGSMNFVGYFFCILVLEEFPEMGHGSLSLSLLWNLEPVGKGKGIVPYFFSLDGYF